MALLSRHCDVHTDTYIHRHTYTGTRRETLAIIIFRGKPPTSTFGQLIPVYEGRLTHFHFFSLGPLVVNFFEARIGSTNGGVRGDQACGTRRPPAGPVRARFHRVPLLDSTFRYERRCGAGGHRSGFSGEWPA